MSDETISEKRHTPGPWLLTVHHVQGYDRLVPVWRINAANNVGIAQEPVYSDEKTADADARLIAAAPDMLAALEWAERAIAPFSKEPAEKSGINMIRAAIAKARGLPREEQ